MSKLLAKYLLISSYPLLIFIVFAKVLSINYSLMDVAIFLGCLVLPFIDNWFAEHWKKQSSELHHHKWVGHYPSSYLPLLIILPLHQPVSVFLALSGIIIHLLLDTYLSKEGIAWFYPANKSLYKSIIHQSTPTDFRPLTYFVCTLTCILLFLHSMSLF